MSGGIVVYIGMGSNLDRPADQLRAALQALHGLPDSTVLGQSSVYRSAPMGPSDQPDYLNAAAMLSTGLSAHDLLHALQAIERDQGRVRRRHWGERTLDLDILLYGEQQIDDAELTVPHVGIAEREFVLYPLAELAPDLQVPGLGPVRDLQAAVDAKGLVRVPFDWKEER